MRNTGVQAYGCLMPIITKGDDLTEIISESIKITSVQDGIVLKESDIIGVTEAIVAKAQGNFASVDDIAEDIRNKFPKGEVGLVFPIISRNRFFNILKGVSRGSKKVYVLLQYPSDEVGNPIMDTDILDDIEQELDGLIPSDKFKELTNNYRHPFTDVDYISLYESAGNNIEVYLSKDPRDILSLTKDVLVAEIHKRFKTKARLLKAGAETVYTLSDILSQPINGSGYNPDYGVLGSNISTNESLKLFPKDCEEFIENLRQKLYEKMGVKPEALVYGDGAFKDPTCGIWELADPVVSPAYSKKLSNCPSEIKLKFVVDNVLNDLPPDEKKAAVTKMIAEKNREENQYSEGTTPRKYADLVGSLCDLISGSGDKGTPVVWIKGYFDDYSMN